MSRVDHQYGAFARSERARNFVSKIYVSGRVDQIKGVNLAVFGFVIEAHGLSLDRNATFFLDIHVIEILILHFPLGNGARTLDQSIGESRFPVIDVCDDAKVSDILSWTHALKRSTVLEI